MMEAKELAGILRKRINECKYVAGSYVLEKLDESEPTYQLFGDLPNKLNRSFIIKILEGEYPFPSYRVCEHCDKESKEKVSICRQCYEYLKSDSCAATDMVRQLNNQEF